MKKRSAVALLLSFILLFSACRANPNDGSTSVSVYYLSNESKYESGSMFKAEAVTISNPSHIVDETIERLFSPPESAFLISPFPAGTRALSFSLKNGTLTLNVSHEYAQLTGVNAVLADYAITLTLCALDDVYSVMIHTDGGRTSKLLTVDDVMNSDTETNPYEKRILLYFPDSHGRYLVPEYHNITIGQDSILVRFVLEELISGPLQAGLQPAVPEGTTLLSVSLNDTVCTLDLSGEFVSNMPDTAAGERMVIYSIVNSLTSISGVDSVQILVDGRRISSYLYIPLDKPLTRFDETIVPDDYLPGTHDITLYVVSPDMQKLIPLPVTINKDEYQTLAFAALEKLIALDTGNAYVNPFPKGTKVLSAVVYNNICRINFSPEFADFENKAAEDLACKSIAASLLTLGDINDIQIFINGIKRVSANDELVESVYNNPQLFLS